MSSPLNPFVIPFQVTPSGVATVLLLVLISLYLGFALVALWVYPDARARSMNGWLWSVAVAGVPVAGLIAYMIMRRERPSEAGRSGS